MKVLKVASLMLGLVVSGNASAALVNHGSYTTDTATGLDWLDLTATVNLSYDYVSSEFGPGGKFEGWTLASTSQVVEFLDNAGGSGVYEDWSTENNGVVSPLLKLWGDFSTDIQNNSVHFLHGDVNIYGQHMLAYLFDTSKSTQGLSSDLMRLDNGYWTDTSASTQVGSALVRPTVVPLPAAVWLFGAGLGGLLSIARRRKSRS